MGEIVDSLALIVTEKDMNLIPIVAAFISILGLVYMYFGVIFGIKEQMAKMGERQARLEVKADLFWKTIEDNVVKLLKTYPSNVPKDVLLDMMVRGELSLENARLLRTILIEENKNTIKNPQDPLAYALVLGRVEQIILEMGGKNIK